MLKKSKLITLAATTALLVTPLAACGSSSEGGSTTEGSGAKTTITYFSWANSKKMAKLVETFEKANPDIKIDMSSAAGGANEYVQTLITRISGNQIPDVYHISTATKHDIISGGWARDLTNEPFMKGLDPTGVAQYTVDGKAYGMTPTVWMGTIIFNKKLLKEAGYDKVPTTLTEFNDMGKKLQEKGIVAYMEDPGVISGSFIPMLGGWYAKNAPASDKQLFDGQETFEKQWTPLLKQWNTLVETGTMPKTVVGVPQDQIFQEFLAGKLAMYRSGMWDVKQIKEAGIDFEAAPFPALEGGEAFVGGGPDSPFAISSKIDGKKLEAAQKFLTFVNSEEGLKLLDSEVGQLSSSANYKAEVPAEFKDVYENYVQKGKYYWLNWPKNGPVMAKEMTAQFQLMIQGQATPDQVAGALDKKWTK
ncbi:hypothetical protein BSR29_02065 [Boudabousia liubingyangii]|uniref:ABC transporter substrate-binding protein n=1 Tax=Boudabousia liubingyangii TaxID=1921764 RepID=A0A1Q5PQ64_9ACTO|nr:extracellular solute-binding protein [Boudabousia liubingyangii]OKL48207.1 hypothetical protein BSR28_00385 [Boudabousia liubingyangii]OKL49758.1 hypothetical protein BSR29_02065 [Boudabousia liubingyangii]